MTAAGLCVAAVAGAADPGAVDPGAVDWPKTGEEPALRAIVDTFDEIGAVQKNADGSLKQVSLGGRGSKDNASLSLRFDPKTQRVTAIQGNVAGFQNDEFALFAPLTDLKQLNLFHNACDCERALWPTICDGAGLAALKGNAKLETITLAGSPLDNDGLAAVAELPQLKSLRIWHVAVTDAGFAALRNHPGLEAIRVGPMWSPTITDATLEHLSHCPNMKTITFGESYVTWEHGLRHLTKLQGTLKTLDLADSVVAPEDLDRLRAAMPGLTVKHAGLPAVGALIVKNFKGAGKKLAKWVPQPLLDQYVAAADETK